MATMLNVYADTMQGGRCKSCSAKLTWYRLTSDKWHPFDGQPVYVRTEREPETNRVIGVIDTSVSPSHFSSCPDGRSWSKKGK